MRNPYRRTACYSLRGFVVAMIVGLGVIQGAMLVMMVDAITTPDENGGRSIARLVVASVGLVGLLLVEVRGIYFLTSGWEKLWDKPWKVLGQGAANFVFGLVYVALGVMGHALWGGTVEQILMGIVGIVLLGDLVGTGAVFMKVRKH